MTFKNNSQFIHSKQFYTGWFLVQSTFGVTLFLLSYIDKIATNGRDLNAVKVNVASK